LSVERRAKAASVKASCRGFVDPAKGRQCFGADVTVDAVCAQRIDERIAKPPENQAPIGPPNHILMPAGLACTQRANCGGATRIHFGLALLIGPRSARTTGPANRTDYRESPQI
jgi:hypothetical protein